MPKRSRTSIEEREKILPAHEDHSRTPRRPGHRNLRKKKRKGTVSLAGPMFRESNNGSGNPEVILGSHQSCLPKGKKRGGGIGIPAEILARKFGLPGWGSGVDKKPVIFTTAQWPKTLGGEASSASHGRGRQKRVPVVGG